MSDNSVTNSRSMEAPPARRVQLWAVPMALAGAALWLRPTLLAGRFHGAERDAALALAPWFGLSLLAASIVAACWRLLGSDEARLRAQCALAVLVYVPITLGFADWHIDDAAITYAYSENLVRGFGLVLHPHHAPEEAYSNTLWMLALAGMRALGMDVARAAKLLGTAVASFVMVLSLLTVRRMLGRPLRGAAFAVLLSAQLTAPFLIWSISGLEHGLQAALLLGYVYIAAHSGPASRTAGALIGAMLVLVRPEAPLLIFAFTLCLALEAWRARGQLRDVLRVWPVAVIPALTLAGLLVFRALYFGDLLPNPYYAKAAEHASFIRLLNPLSEGYRYLASWLASGAGFLLLVPPLLLLERDYTRPVQVALAMLGAQLAFVVYAGGDWMGHWRFLCATVPLFALLCAYGMERAFAERRTLATRYAGLTLIALWMCNVPLLVGFRSHPTTPYAEVSAVGNSFVALAARLGIAQPLLAHHDAGGTSYRARIDLLDLGGLGTRIVAKHFGDPAFLRHYILEQRKPDFVFGTTQQFAAGYSRFHETPAFLRDYVRLDFPDQKHMQADLCHVRRDRLREVPGVQVAHDADGTSRVVVRTTESAAPP
jgi:hypothetical protein